MAARHRASSPDPTHSARRVVLVGALVLVAVVAAGFLVTALSGSGFCGDRREVTVAAEPDIADHVAALAEEARGCDAYAVEPVSSADIAARVASREAVPDIWVPDSAIRLAQVSQDVQIPFDTVMNSIASTPAVIASRDAEVDLSTWTSALATPGLMMGDPVRSGIADAPILSATSEVEAMRSTPEALDTAMAALAQSQSGRMEVPPTAPQMLEAVIAQGGAAIVSEQQAVSVLDSADDALDVAAPETASG